MNVVNETPEKKIDFPEPVKVSNWKTHSYISKIPLGIGCMINLKPIYADRPRLFTFEIKLLWCGFWIVRFIKPKKHAKK